MSSAVNYEQLRGFGLFLMPRKEMIMKLTEKQKRFVDEYIISLNATDAARKAGYKQPHVQGSQNLDKPSVKASIKAVLDKIQAEKFLTMEEALQMTASIARGEPQVTMVKGEEVTQLPDIRDRQKALENFFKINGAFTEKREIDLSTNDVKIVIRSGDDDADD